MNTKSSGSFLKFALPMLVTATFWGGCLGTPTPPARVHMFAPLHGWDTFASRDLGIEDPRIAFTPISLPTYLDRSQLVVRQANSDSELEVLEFDRWGPPLSAGVMELLAGRVMQAIPQVYVEVLPSRRPNASGYGVNVHVLRMEGPLGGLVDLIAQWEITDGRGEKLLFRRLGHYRGDSGGDASIPAYIRALREAAQALGDDIAGHLVICGAGSTDAGKESAAMEAVTDTKKDASISGKAAGRSGRKAKDKK